MKRVRRAYRKMKDRIRNFDLQNQQHQLLIVLVIVATLLFALLHSVLRSIFFTNGHYSSISEATMQVQMIDAKCWGEYEDNAVWKTELKYINCRSKDTFSIYGYHYNETEDGAGIRHKFRTVYENDVVKHLSQQIKFDDFTSNTSKVCNVHMLDHMNLYFNHNVVHFLNISHDHNHSSSGISANRLNTQPQQQQQQQRISQLLTRSALQHSRLSDAGMCAQLSYSGSNGGVGNNALVKCLPSFIIAGVMKSGTGELMKWLNTHPNLVSGSGSGGKNEIHYFSHHQLPQCPDSDPSSLTGSRLDNKSNVPPLSNSAKSQGIRDNVKRERTPKNIANVTSAGSHSHRQRTLRESRSLSDSSRPVANFLDYLQYFPSFHGSSQVDTLYTFDKSPDYIRSPNVIYNIRNMLPSVKLVILLRDPVQRAISAFNHNCRHGRYVKLSRDVVVEGELLAQGSVLSTESSDVHFSRNSSSISAASNRTTSHLTYSVSLGELSKKDYTVLTYPCTAADMHSYFFGAAQTRAAGKDRHRLTGELGPNAAREPVPRAPSNETITSSVKDNALLQIDDHDCAPEIAHGFYDAQLSYVLKIFPMDQVLILFQENMYKNTFKTLREVETFLSLPCFDYSTVTLLPSTSNGLSFDDREDGKQLPPKRAPVTIEETLTHYKNVVKSFFQAKRPSTSSSSSKLQRETSPLTRALLSSIFSRHNRQLQELLLRHQMTKQANSISELKWDL